MTDKPLDRRVKRTRRALQEALLSLVQTQDFDALTVTDITRAADLRRATFYLHYETKEDLLLAALEETFDELVASTREETGGDVIAGKTRPQAYRVTFEHVAQNANLYRKLFSGNGGAVVQRHIREYLARLVLDSLQQLPDDDLPLPRPVIAHYIAGTELALVLWWLDAGMPHTAEEMANMAHQLVLAGVQGALGERIYRNTP